MHATRVAPEKAVFRPALSRASFAGALTEHAMDFEGIDQIEAGALEVEWLRERNTNKRWEIIRKVYALQMPAIMAARRRTLRSRTDPYFIDWDFTPIEYLAWQDIRSRGLPFYPQVPVGRYFLDFGDPLFKIGVELDGKAYHEATRDKKRDEELWGMGWRIFRIPGRKAYPHKNPPFTPEWHELRGNYPSDAERQLDDWSSGSSEGVFWSLEQIYYRNPLPDNADDHSQRLRYFAQRSLEMHQLVMFPIELHQIND